MDIGKVIGRVGRVWILKCFVGTKTWNFTSNRKSSEAELSGGDRHNVDSLFSKLFSGCSVTDGEAERPVRGCCSNWRSWEETMEAVEKVKSGVSFGGRGVRTHGIGYGGWGRRDQDGFLVCGLPHWCWCS